MATASWVKTKKKNAMATASWVKTKIAGTQQRTTTKKEVYAKKTRAVIKETSIGGSREFAGFLRSDFASRRTKETFDNNFDDRGGRLRGISASARRLPARRWLFRSQIFDKTTTADARNRIICPKETTSSSSTNISPLLSFYDQLRTLRQNSNLSHVFELRPDLANVGGSSDFVESNCSASSTASSS